MINADGNDPPESYSCGLSRRVTIAVGAGLAFIVAHDGTPVWQASRLLVVVALTVLAWRTIARGRRPTAIAVAIAVGLIAVPVGIGIAVPHVSKAGATPLAIAGLVALLGGVVTLIIGIVGLVRSVRRRVSVPSATAAVVVALTLVLTLGQAVAANNVPRPGLGSRTPADVGLAYRDVEFPATDGVALSGWYVPSHNRAAVVLLHGAGSTRSNVLDHAAVLSRHGYGVLLYDARGHGRSDGQAMDFGWFGDRDVGGAIAFVRRQADVDPSRVGAMGMSMGGEQAVGAAASIDAIGAVVAEGATNRVAGDKSWLSDEFGLRGALSERVEALTYGFADLLTSASPPITLHDAVRAAAPRPVLLIAAGLVPDEARAARYIQQAAPDSVDVWVAPRATHTHALNDYAAEWERRVISFLDQALGVDDSEA